MMGWGCSTVHKHILAGGAGSSLSWRPLVQVPAEGWTLGSPRLRALRERDATDASGGGSGSDPSLPLRLLGKEHGSGLLPKVGTLL